MVNVTKTYLPDFDDYTRILRRAWDKGWITNNGDLVRELEESLRKYLGVEYLLFTSNGTLALQMSLKALNVTKEVITTAFSYVATTNAILWEHCMPVFADINRNDYCINADEIENLITENTQAILATHVYGLPCNIEKIETIASRYDLKVIYDGAHAFGSHYKNKSLLSYGDISTCSFHATKLFHTGEGGCIICHDQDVYDKLFLIRNFGHKMDDYFCVGINAKNSEMHAALGLSMLPHVRDIIEENRRLFYRYVRRLDHPRLGLLQPEDEKTHNYGYFPVLFEDEATMIKAKNLLEEHSIYPRRYFYPSLNSLPFLEKTNGCPVSEDVSRRILCLPLYFGLAEKDVESITSLVLKVVER